MKIKIELEVEVVASIDKSSVIDRFLCVDYDGTLSGVLADSLDELGDSVSVTCEDIS